MGFEKGNYDVIDHTADIGIKAVGESLEEAFINAAKGMFDLIAPEDNVEPVEKKTFTIEEEDVIMLFKRWLEELLYLFDAERFLPSKYDLKILKSEKAYKLVAEVYGEEYKQDKHGSGMEIKAVTYHMMEIEKRGDKFYVQVIFDV
ncbi:MAG: archease [Candidatus Njordarchaeia archaeon]